MRVSSYAPRQVMNTMAAKQLGTFGLRPARGSKGRRRESVAVCPFHMGRSTDKRVPSVPKSRVSDARELRFPQVGVTTCAVRSTARAPVGDRRSKLGGAITALDRPTGLHFHSNWPAFQAVGAAGGNERFRPSRRPGERRERRALACGQRVPV